jgi:hypothetical protein
MLELQDALWNQREKLNDDQRRAVDAHPAVGAALLRRFGVENPLWLNVVEQHHDGCHGSRYAAGQPPQSVQREAQVVCIVDRYCAMVAERGYRAGLLPNIALRKLFLEGRNADAEFASMLVKEVGIYPPGTFLRLANGDIGVVVRRTGDVNRPVVRAMIGARGALPDFPKRAIGKPQFAIAEAMPAQKLRVEVDFKRLWRLAEADAIDAEARVTPPAASVSGTETPVQ